ncbi:putative secreted protein [Lachnellula subtilissima]|uniref:Putative secreted protein n=1 Tax=Lachnellula subtilissima TaxID=602034 RepID=A0A8H8RAW5_9HELO|nr:putative secreted protein [Lachnellula subtilissima]
MLYSWLLPYGFAFAIAANAQDSSSDSSSVSASGSDSVSVLTGITEDATPTGDYISYASTITMPSTSAITTSEIVSIITSGSTTRTTTLGSTTLFGVGTSIITTNTSTATGSDQSTVTSSSDSQVLLSGLPKTSSMSLNSTTNATSTSTSSSTLPTNTTPCNNYPEFCSRKYGNITEVSAHNSPFVKTGNAAANQELSVTTQLNDGIRLLQGQMHFVNNTPHFCHTSCDVLDAGPITSYLSEVYAWVSTHPYDIVTLLLGNGNYSKVETYVPFIQSTGLVQYAYEPPKIPMALNDWPTLASMILSGKRVVFFMDYDANQTAVPWILDEFSQMWETPFDPTDRSFPCTAQRPPNLSDNDAKNRMYLTNHNLNYDISILGNSLLVPEIPLLNITNNITGDGSLGVSTHDCVQEWDYPPKFLNVDFYNVGNGSVFEVAAKYNNVTYTRACCGLPVSGAGKLVLAKRSAGFAALGSMVLLLLL